MTATDAGERRRGMPPVPADLIAVLADADGERPSGGDTPEEQDNDAAERGPRRRGGGLRRPTGTGDPPH